MNISENEIIQLIRKLKKRRVDNFFSFIANSKIKIKHKNKKNEKKTFKELLNKTNPIVTYYHNINEGGKENLYLWQKIFEIDAKSRYEYHSLTPINLVVAYPGILDKIFLCSNIEFLSSEIFEKAQKDFNCLDINFRAINKIKKPQGHISNMNIIFAESYNVKKDEIIVAGTYSGFELSKSVEVDKTRIESNAVNKNGVEIGEIHIWGVIKIK